MIFYLHVLWWPFQVRIVWMATKKSLVVGKKGWNLNIFEKNFKLRYANRDQLREVNAKKTPLKFWKLKDWYVISTAESEAIEKPGANG